MLAKVCIIGIGYIGLPTALKLAEAGLEVVGVDVDHELIARINDGSFNSQEPGLTELYQKVRKRFSATIEVPESDAFIIAVGTPLLRRRKAADLSAVERAIRTMCPKLRPNNLVVLESTVPPLTCRELVAPLITELTGYQVPEDILLAHCPERVIPGNILCEITENSRIVGGVNTSSINAAKALYKHFVTGPLLLTDDVTAELCKLAENTYRDVNIALANQLADVAKSVGVCWQDLFQLANHHPRVNLLAPGIGVGGHCLPIDPWFIAEVNPLASTLLQEARRINDARPREIASALRQEVADCPGAKIVIIGMTYKPDTEDCRESPAMAIADELRNDGYQVTQYDPLVPGYTYCSLSDAARGADLLAVLVQHTVVREELTHSYTAIMNGMRRQRIVLY